MLSGGDHARCNLDTDQPMALSPLGRTAAGCDGRLFRFEIIGTGFLRHMVRNIAGTLVDIGRGQMEVDDMAANYRFARSSPRRDRPPRLTG